MSRRAAPPPAERGWDPFDRVYKADGSIDREYAAKRIPTLVDLIRKNPALFPARVDIDTLSSLLIGDDAQPVREATSPEGFETALRAFSRARLHELVPEELHKTMRDALVTIARDAAVNRRDRAAAAIGIAFLVAPPDAKGLRGRAVADLLLRVTMEEQTANEQMRKKARESEGGLGPDELREFWTAYPALRWRHEERYRREVQHVLREIESGNIPIAISVDLALRGAAALLGSVAKAKESGEQIDSKKAERILRAPFVNDMLDDGPEVVAGRWEAEIAAIEGATSDERRDYRRLLESAVRLIRERGPGSDAILFFAYMRAVVNGHYYVRDPADLEAAKSVFAETGIEPAGAVRYGQFLSGVDAAAKHRLLLAAVEVWPDDAGVRAAATAMGKAEAEAARNERQGPLYEEPGEVE